MRLAAPAMLLLVGMIWGSSLVVVKASTDSVPPAFVIAFRFTLASLTLACVFAKRLCGLSALYFQRGMAVGAALFCAYGIQTLGVTLAMPGKSAFLSSIYCVLVPFAVWALDGAKPLPRHLIAALLCSAGIVLCSVTEGFSVEPGDALALASGVCFALHIALVGRFGKGLDPVLFTLVQFMWCAVFSWIFVILFPDRVSLNGSVLGGLCYLALACTALALLFQNVGQKYAPPAEASILMSTESIFGVIFSVIFMGEAVTPRMVFAFALIFASVLISQIGLNKEGFDYE